MSPPARRSSRTPYRPPRDRREVMLAALCAFTVVAVTVVLLFVLRPRDEAPPAVPAPLPSQATVPPETLVPEQPTETVPPETAPAESTPSPAP
ncbi:MAG: hypothetical protein L0206_09765 [Actinobacteria bacterium]|nr:hypothetical protein [Actinomycetota bacterium]